MKKKGPIITIGSFDGVHRGHQTLLNWTIKEARKRKLSSMALTFSLPPRKILNPKKLLPILSTPLEKEVLIQRYGIKEIVFLEFNRELSHVQPFRFFRRILVDRFNAAGLVVGYDFRFGEGRSAGVHELVRWGTEFDLPVWIVPPVKWQKKIISSTTLRVWLSSGKLKQVNKILGHPYLIVGKRTKGKGKGKGLGFPTLNLQISPEKLLPVGVFVVRGFPLRSGKIVSKTPIWGVCNIGRRPTLYKKGPIVVEIHWLKSNFQSVSNYWAIELCLLLRPEKKYRTIMDLQKAVKNDILKAKKYIKKASI